MAGFDDTVKQIQEKFRDKLTRRQLKAARLLAAGFTQKRVAELIGVRYDEHQTRIARWLKDPDFAACVEEIAELEDVEIEEQLVAAERLAIQVLVDSMSEVDKNGTPTRGARSAARLFLQMAGKRGVPTQKVEQQTLQLTGNASEMLAQALRDPVVRKFIGEQKIVLLPEPIDADFEVIDDRSPVPEGREDAAVLRLDEQVLQTGDEREGTPADSPEVRSDQAGPEKV